MKIVIFTSTWLKPVGRKRYYFRFVARNGEIVSGSEAYNTEQAAVSGAVLVRSGFMNAPIVREDGSKIE